ncbi:MAG: META domain-containing protein [Cyclobacteriaceae bacterium]|nr:META domain-containing protein [Cyclobacteriaceae bacterium]
MKKILLLLIVFSACKPSNKIGELVGVPKERPLENTYWVLVEVNGTTIVRNDTKLIFIQLDSKSKRVTGFAGCNQLSGDYVLDGRKLIFKTVTTRMYCEDEMKTEDDFIEAVNKINEYRIHEHQLSLMQGKNVLLKFQAELERKY